MSIADKSADIISEFNRLEGDIYRYFSHCAGRGTYSISVEEKVENRMKIEPEVTLFLAGGILLRMGFFEAPEQLLKMYQEGRIRFTNSKSNTYENEDGLLYINIYSKHTLDDVYRLVKAYAIGSFKVDSYTGSFLTGGVEMYIEDVVSSELELLAPMIPLEEISVIGIKRYNSLQGRVHNVLDDIGRSHKTEAYKVCDYGNYVYLMNVLFAKMIESSDLSSELPSNVIHELLAYIKTDDITAIENLLDLFPNTNDRKSNIYQLINMYYANIPKREKRKVFKRKK